METDATQQLKILIVEDDIVDRKLLQRLLSQSALSISDIKFAERLDIALGFLDEDYFDVVFLDLGLPDSQGIGSFSAICAKAPAAAVIVLSGLDNEEVAVMAVKKGVQDYFVKGQIDSNLLTRAVRYAVERKRISKILDEKQKNIEAIFDAAPIGMMLVDENMIVKRVNDAIRRILNKDYRQIINQKFGDALGCMNTISSGKGCGNSPACEVCRLHKTIDTVLDSQQPVREVEFQLTLKIDNKEITPWLCISAQPAMMDGCKHVVVAINDITKRKEAEEELRKTEEKYRTQFEGALDAIFVADAETGIIIDCNPAATKLVGREKSELVGKHQRILHPPEKIEGEFSKTFKKHLKEKQGQTLETQVVTKTGEIRDVAIKANLLEVRGKKLLQGIFRDITERKEAEEKLKETMEIKSRFISMVSHELRTPLTSMKEAISIVSDEVAGKINKDQRHFLNIAKRNIDRLARLINEVLDFQKLEAGKMRANIQENDINEVVGEVQKTMLSSAKKKGIGILLELDDNLPKIRFDRDKIIQVLTNLIDNAVKVTPEKGQVSVFVQHKGEDLVIRVSDTGMGIPKEDLPKIFDRFHQVHQPGQQIKGTGLGLPIVKKIVMMHGGRIEVESEVGQGTTFTAFLPLDGKPTPEVLPEKMDEFLEDTVVDSQAHTK